LFVNGVLVVSNEGGHGVGLEHRRNTAWDVATTTGYKTRDGSEGTTVAPANSFGGTTFLGMSPNGDGWHDIEIRMGNASSGAGPSGVSWTAMGRGRSFGRRWGWCCTTVLAVKCTGLAMARGARLADQRVGGAVIPYTGTDRRRQSLSERQMCHFALHLTDNQLSSSSFRRSATNSSQWRWPTGGLPLARLGDSYRGTSPRSWIRHVFSGHRYDRLT
jgi:hypothetical protein